MEHVGVGVLTILGIGVFGSVLNALLFKKLRIPQVLGYMVVGIIIGESGFKLINSADIKQLMPVNLFCLSVIGFLVGCEINFRTMKKYASQFSAILFLEGTFAFLLVGIAVFLIIFYLTHNAITAVSAAVVFGAIASATDPASTIAVLWEYRAAGVLATTVTAIVALDDALAMSLYGLGSGIAQILSGGNVNIFIEMGRVLLELGGSVALGIGAGYIISIILLRSQQIERSTTSTVGLLLLVAGLCRVFNLDIILAAMAAGITVVNRVPKRAEHLIDAIKGFSVIIYIVFFVFVGARLHLGAMPGWLWGIVAAYILFRSFGKMFGAWIGAKFSKADDMVARYTGSCLFAQGGVAIGLSIMAAQHLKGVQVADGLSLGDTIIFGVTTTTFFVQLLGPQLVKWSIFKARENGKNITEEDHLLQLSVKDVLEDPALSQVDPTATIRDIFTRFSGGIDNTLVVCDKERHVAGIITFEQLRASVMAMDTWDWIIAADVAVEPIVKLSITDNLLNAVRTIRQISVQELIVFDQQGRYAGLCRYSAIMGAVRRRMINVPEPVVQGAT